MPILASLRRVLLCLALSAAGLPVFAGLPQPLCVYYGQARDGYGLPYQADAEVVLLRGSQEIASQSITGSLSPGVNFALYVHLDDGRAATNYSTRAVRSGDAVTLVVRDRDGQHTVMEQRTVPRASQPGDLILIQATASEDADDDGLPDTWEQELVDWSFGALSSIWDVKGSDDFDGDGMSNLEEYEAGTFAFLGYDYFRIELMSRTPGGRLCLTFLSVPGKCYTALACADLGETWSPCAFALSDTAPLQTIAAEGTGDWLSIYLPIDQPNCFLRLTAR